MNFSDRDSRSSGFDAVVACALFKAYHKQVYLRALMISRDSTLADDITQETFINIGKSVHQVRDPALLEYWVMQVTNHTAGRVLQKRNVIAREIPIDNVELRNNDSSPTGECELHMVVNDLLDELSPSQRNLLLLYYGEDKPVDLISTELDIPVGTVKSRLARARERFREIVLRKAPDLATDEMCSCVRNQEGAVDETTNGGKRHASNL